MNISIPDFNYDPRQVSWMTAPFGALTNDSVVPIEASVWIPSSPVVVPELSQLALGTPGAASGHVTCQQGPPGATSGLLASQPGPSGATPGRFASQRVSAMVTSGHYPSQLEISGTTSSHHSSRPLSMPAPPRRACKIRRPPNAFMLFANENRKILAKTFPHENNQSISIRLGVMWRSLGADYKNMYYQMAKDAAAEHKRLYPSYVYSPKEARMRKQARELVRKVKEKGWKPVTSESAADNGAATSNRNDTHAKLIEVAQLLGSLSSNKVLQQDPSRPSQQSAEPQQSEASPASSADGGQADTVSVDPALPPTPSSPKEELPAERSPPGSPADPDPVLPSDPDDPDARQTDALRDLLNTTLMNRGADGFQRDSSLHHPVFEHGLASADASLGGSLFQRQSVHYSQPIQQQNNHQNCKSSQADSLDQLLIDPGLGDGSHCYPTNHAHQAATGISNNNRMFQRFICGNEVWATAPSAARPAVMVPHRHAAPCYPVFDTAACHRPAAPRTPAAAAVCPRQARAAALSAPSPAVLRAALCPAAAGLPRPQLCCGLAPVTAHCVTPVCCEPGACQAVELQEAGTRNQTRKILGYQPKKDYLDI